MKKSAMSTTTSKIYSIGDNKDDEIGHYNYRIDKQQRQPRL